MSVLLIGRGFEAAWGVALLLKKGGFQVDVITSSLVMWPHPCIRKLIFVMPREPLYLSVREALKGQYDWIVVTEDGSLQELCRAPLSLEEKLKCLPVKRGKNLYHLYSKIGLSEVFQQQGVNTPPFKIARNEEEVFLAAADLRYPVFVKVDASGGGAGVFECTTPEDIQLIRKEVFKEPVLVQKKICGIELDLSAVYLEEELIHFNYARVEKVCMNRFGPSSLRTYFPLSGVEEAVFHELALIGKALGAHGFTNIGCMQQSDGKRFYFEVDMRPNVWVDYPSFLGEDPGLRIRNGLKLSYPVFKGENEPSHLIIPYFLRLKRWEILCNRYSVWKFLPKGAPLFVFYLVVRKMVFFHLTPLIKWILPRKCHPAAKRLQRGLVKFFQS